MRACVRACVRFFHFHEGVTRKLSFPCAHGFEPTIDEGSLGADDDEADVLLLAEGDNRGVGVKVDMLKLGLERHILTRWVEVETGGALSTQAQTCTALPRRDPSRPAG